MKKDFDKGVWQIFSYTYRFKIKESDVFIKTDLENALDLGINTIKKHRLALKRYIFKHKDFLYSYKPLPVDEDAPLVVRMMQEVTEFIDVGPMAAVAGALADLVLEKLKTEGSKNSIVENGGEITAISEDKIYVAIYAGESTLSGKIGFKLSPAKDFPFGLGTSSGSFGRGFSFGQADAATVVSTNATIGDAAATFIGNQVIGKDIEKSVQAGLEAAESLEKIKGALIIRGKYAGTTGKLPEFIKITGDPSKLLEKKYDYKIDEDFIIL